MSDKVTYYADSLKGFYFGMFHKLLNSECEFQPSKLSRIIFIFTSSWFWEVTTRNSHQSEISRLWISDIFNKKATPHICHNHHNRWLCKKKLATQCIILHTVYNLKHSVKFYAQFFWYFEINIWIWARRCYFTLFCRKTPFVANLCTFKCKISRPQIAVVWKKRQIWGMNGQQLNVNI